MNIEKNQKTFNYLFYLFVTMGEEKLGRRLTNDEINNLRPLIQKKCETINKKDIVREIYNLEKSNREQEKGHLSSKEKKDLRKKITAITNCPVKYTSSSDVLVKAVSNSFANIHISDALKRNPNLKLKPQEIFKTKKRELRDSYITDHFHYKSPTYISDNMKRFVALGGALLFTTAFSTMVHLSKSSFPVQEETTITQVSEPEVLTPKDYLIDSIKQHDSSWIESNASLKHFKNVFANEFNNINNSELSSEYIQIRSVPHTFIYKLASKSGEEFYVTKGNSPGTTKDLLEQAGYTCQGVSNYNRDVKVISVITDSDNFIAACALIDGKYVPICADGSQFTNHKPSQQELSSGYSDIINSNSVANAELLADLCSTRAFDKVCDDNRNAYAECLLKYIKQRPDSQLAKDVNSAISKSKNPETKNNTYIETEAPEIDY